jgi:hypothetical protein
MSACRILKGSRQQFSRSNAVGLTMPTSILQHADEVIE